MALRDHAIPNESIYTKLSDFGDGEKIEIKDCGINEKGKYGPQAYFISFNGEFISLPVRYVDFVREILNDTEAIKEIRGGVSIVKNSRECGNGTTTAIFEFI